MRVLNLSRYASLGASTRIRSLQYLPWLERANVQVTVQSLMSNAMLQHRYAQGRYGLLALVTGYTQRLRVMQKRGVFDVVWIEKEALPWWPLWIEQAMLAGVPYVLDYDDAVFHNYDLHSSKSVRMLYGRRLDGLMAHAALVVAGNNYLAQRARDAGAKWVEVVPSVIDLAHYPITSPALLPVSQDGVLRIVWIGSPTTAHYLQLLREPLRALALQYSFVLRVIGGGPVEMPGVQVEVVPWSEATEFDAIRGCHVGIMPLSDSPWERGKCGYKLIQYMACGLPVVASDVGVNSAIVQNLENGFLAKTSADWVAALGQLLDSEALRVRLGRAGRARVEEKYCIQQTAPRLVKLLQNVTGNK
jgi:glycosyltransferase involved in cell wall biosynthesis